MEIVKIKEKRKMKRKKLKKKIKFKSICFIFLSKIKLKILFDVKKIEWNKLSNHQRFIKSYRKCYQNKKIL